MDPPPPPDGPEPATPSPPRIDRAAPLQFVINAASGQRDAQAKQDLIVATLDAAGRRGDLHLCGPGQVPEVAQHAAQRALASRSAVVAVGGDGTINAVAQAAHGAGCAMGVVPQGTFNYFARTHHIPEDPAQALRALLDTQVTTPVQVAGINAQVFLVNASLGLYPELLEDREAYKSRFGRSRWVALWAALVTLMRAQQPLRLRITQGGRVRDVRTLTLFVGNNRLQLEQVGVEPPALPRGGEVSGRITAVMLRPVSTLTMIGLMLRGALGTLGDADSVEHFEFERLVVSPHMTQGRWGIKVAFDGEVTRMRAPLDFHVLHQPLYLMLPRTDETNETDGTAGAAAA